jgi:hypothetical protein
MIRSSKISWLPALAILSGCVAGGDEPEPTPDAGTLEQREGVYGYVLGVDPETGEPIYGGAHEVVGFDDQGKREAIDTLNRVSRFHPDMTPTSAFHLYDESLTEGESDVYVFASQWWPQSKNGTAWRWQPGAGQDYNVHTDVSRLSPIEKYDTLVNPGQTRQVAAVSHCEYGDFVENGEDCEKIDRPALTVAGPATQWELQNQGTYQTYDPENWWGHCNGWASYATTEPLGFPVRDVSVRLEAGEIVECASASEPGCVLFKMADVEALMTELYFSDQATFTGRRCNTAPDEIERDADGRPTDPACRDLNPGSFHVAITGAFGRGARNLVEGREAEHPPFIIDYNYDHEIWNYPVVDYQILDQEEITEAEAQELVGAAGSNYQWNASATQFRRVDMRFHMISDGVPASQLGLRADQRGIDPVPVDLHYVLELDANGRILGGEWIESPTAFVNSKELHPDFVWMAIDHRGAGENADDLGGTNDNPYVAYSQVRSILLCANDPDTCAPAGTGGVDVLLDVTSTVNGGATQTFTTETLAAGHYTVTMTHDPAAPGGDADLYVRAGSAPTASVYDCRPYLNGSDEVCEIDLASDAVIHMMVRGYNPGANAFRLVVEGEGEGGGGEPEPTEWAGMSESGTIAKNAETRFSTGTLGAGTYVFEMTGTGDADLYVRTGAEPTTTTWDCRPYGGTSNETCTVNLDASAEVFVMVRGYATSSTWALTGAQQ